MVFRGGTSNALADAALSTTATLVDGNWTASENAAAATRQTAINTAYHTYADNAGEADKTLATSEATAAKARDLAQDTALTAYEKDSSQNAVDKQSAQWTATKTYTPVQVNAARDWAKAVKDAAAYLKQNLNAAEAALLDGVAAIVAEKEEVFKTIDGNRHVDVAKIRQDAVVQKWAATLAAHQAASESTFADVELQRPALVQTALNADANSSRATGFFAGIEQGLNALTGGESRAVLLSPEFTAALNAFDGFFAGVADSLTAGLSTRLRSAMWGEAATQNHDGPWFTAGQITGAILSIPVMAANPCSLGAVFGVGLRVLNGVQLVGNGISAVENIAAGNYLSAGMNVLGMVANLNQLRRACFTGEMNVLTIDGYKRWDQLEANDSVAAGPDDDPDAPIKYKKVESVFCRLAEIWHVHMNGYVIRTTDEHPFYVWGRGWVPTNDLQAGDRLRSWNGIEVIVEEVFKTSETALVYNCQVSEYHTYFVAPAGCELSVWAHNTGCDDAVEAGLNIASQSEAHVLRGVERHHPVFRYLLRGFSKAGYAVRTALGRLRPQRLVEMPTNSHRAFVHELWDDVMRERGLHRGRNASDRIANLIRSGDETPTEILDDLENFYNSALSDYPEALDDVLRSVQSMRSRIGL